jgi:integrase/recombinase XerD
MAMKNLMKRNHVDTNNFSLDNAFQQYILEKEIGQGLSEATINMYKHTYDKFVAFVGENKVCNSIVIENIYEWIKELQKGGCKNISVNHWVRCLRTFLYWCMEKNYIDVKYKIDLLKCQEEPLKTFTDEEQKALIAVPKRKNDFVECRTYTVVNFVLDSGSRLSTIVNIRMQDVNLPNREIVLAHTKNKKAHVLPMSKAFANVLSQYIREWRSKAKQTDYLFCNVGGEKLEPNALKNSFRRYCKRRGVEKTSIHGLRHSFATEYIKNNGSTFALQKILGHSTLEMTKKYVSLATDDIKNDYDTFSPLANHKKGLSRTKTVQRAV